MSEALCRNPRAMAEHLWWNAQLIPNGLQVLLFHGMSGRINPDYPPVQIWSVVLPISLLAMAIVIVGLILHLPRTAILVDVMARGPAWAWIAMACIACAMPAVMLSQRPRPSYLFVFGIALRAVIGLCGLALVRRSWFVEAPR